ncbi:hypothetical protein MVEN_02248800 [Mycena venus]|uniref:Uncharacterized protein n=1 Tax=Mycena venus TaxID=2733690 RepID=A0A8H6X6G8_9AGAR|nr:hypothetical protein MVEN_02248800 [Mycena venus]
MFSSTFSLTPFLLLGGLQLVNAQTTITGFAPVASGDPLITPGINTPIGVLSDGKVVATEHGVVTVPGEGVGNFDGIVVQGSNDLEGTAVITAQGGGQTEVLNLGESCSFATASASGAQQTGNCVLVEDVTLLGQGKATHVATTGAVTLSDFTTIIVPSALPTLSDSVLNLKKGSASGLRVTFASVLVGAAFGAANIWL